MRKKLPEELRRKRINIMLNDEERKAILENSKKYHYGNNLAKYVRAMCLCPIIFIEDMEGRKELTNETSKVMTELSYLTWQIRQMTKRIDISKSDILSLNRMIERTQYLHDSLVSFINRKISFEYRKEIRKKETAKLFK